MHLDLAAAEASSAIEIHTPTARRLDGMVGGLLLSTMVKKLRIHWVQHGCKLEVQFLQTHPLRMVWHFACTANFAEMIRQNDHHFMSFMAASWNTTK